MLGFVFSGGTVKPPVELFIEIRNILETHQFGDVFYRVIGGEYQIGCTFHLLAQDVCGDAFTGFLLELTADVLGTQVEFIGHIIQRDGIHEVLVNELVDGQEVIIGFSR